MSGLSPHAQYKSGPPKRKINSSSKIFVSVIIGLIVLCSVYFYFIYESNKVVESDKVSASIKFPDNFDELDDEKKEKYIQMIKDALGKDDIEIIKFRKGSVIVDLKLDPELAKKLSEDKEFLNRLKAESMEIGDSIHKKSKVIDSLPQTGVKYVNEDTPEVLKLESGKEIEVETGLFSMGRVQGVVFHDLNGNGFFDQNESGVENVIVNLNKLDGTTVSTAITNSEGRYSFSERKPGVYYISFDLPKGMAFSPNIDSDLLPYSEEFKIIKSDVDVDTGNSSTFSLHSGSNKTEINAGIFKYSSIKGIIFEDFDGDGIFQKNIDQKSIGIQNGFIEVYPAGSKELIQKVEISVDGDYEINDLVPRAYRLKFILPNNFRISKTHPLSSL